VSRAFTLMELLVVTGIIVIISALLLVNHNQFGGRALLENLAYDVGLSIRQAQVYGIAVRQYGSGNFDVGYGMYFDAALPTRYDLFGDADASGIAEPGESIPPSPYTIGRGYFIYKLCAPAGSDAETCTAVSRLDILFRRPEPDAYIGKNGVSGVAQPQESARIVFRSPRGDETSVVVEVTGQISVD
jgi:prepilin-type N-terminal cleavage/methylation domain-containing protein